MGRWRPPSKASSPYITAAGATALQAELSRLWKTDRREVVKALAAAAAEGDRSENAEYIYRKRQLGGIDRRIRYLALRLDVVQVVDRIPEDQQHIRFGAWVSLENRTADGAGNKPMSCRIVGADETDAKLGWISIDSPVARSLLGAETGNTIRVTTPEGAIQYRVMAVSYSDPAGADKKI
jgi:transcription elongation factor GreB